MNTPDRLPLKSPTNILFRNVKFDFRKLLPTMGKASINAVLLKWEDLAKDGVEVANTLGVKQNEGELAWLWVSQSVLQAILRLCKQQEKLLPSSLNFEDLSVRLNQTLAEDGLFIDNEFCQHFDQHSLTKILQNCFTDWLVANQVKAESITEISKSFNAYFIFALHQEAKTNSTTYQPIEWRIKQLNEKAGETEKAWLKYGLWLQEQVDEPLFGVEDFSLRQIYISLRTYVVREKENQSKNHEWMVMDLHSAIQDWLQQSDRRDGLRIICGGPGCGKSSFTKMLAAELAERGDRVLLIPLHEIDPTQPLENALDQYIKKFRITPLNPLKSENSQNRLLLIFDGLDELAMQGKLATEIAQNFVDKVKDELRGWNHTDLSIRVLISGRELVVQHLGEAKDSHQVLHLLPYWLSEEDLKKDNYVDEQQLLKIDQRQNWWRRYGELKQKNYQGLPKELAQIETLQEITAQPLLNYLVALSYDAGELDFSEGVTLNQIYKDLLHRVYKREWASIQHPTLKNAQIDEDQFVQAMAEIAVACWHGNGRTTTVADIEKHCQHSGIRSVLEVFKISGSQGVTQLLTAFYFRQQGVQGRDKTFEFTHKSFREYLTVRRMITEIEAIEEESGQHHNNSGRDWTEQECLRRWAVLCGAEAMDRYLFEWLLGEIQLQPLEKVAKWQKLFCDLIEYMLLQGMPMEKLKGLSFLQMSQQSRNAEEALLVVLNICARITKIVSKIEWEKRESFGEWLSKLRAQRVDDNNTLAFDCLSYLDLENCTLILKDLYKANLQEGNLREADLREADLRGANLRGANLQKANLEGASLQGASLQGVKLQGANLEKANLQGAYLEGAYLFGTHLVEAKLFGANLRRAYLQRANLRRAYLRGAYLQEVYLEEAILIEAKLSKVDLEGVNTRNVDLSQVIWVDDNGNPLN